MGGKGSGRRPTIYHQPRIWEQPAPPRPPKPLEYQIVDILSEDGIGDNEREAIRVILMFVVRLRREQAEALAESEIEALRHDLARVTERENRYLNALTEISASDGAAGEIAAHALYGEPPASGIEARSDETPQAARPEGQEPGPKGDAQPSSPTPSGDPK